MLDDKIIEAENAPSRAQRMLVPNDIIFQTVRPYQQNNYFYEEERDLPTIASTGYAVIRTKQDPKFIYSLIHTKRFLTPVMQRCTGSSYPAVTGSDLEDIPIWTPCLEEQKRIGALLDLIGKKIDAQTKLIESLKKYKRGAVKRIFANKSDWEKCKISDVAHIATGHSNTQDKVEDGTFPFFIRSQTVARSNRYLYDGEAVLTIGDGQIGKVFHYYVGKFDCHQRVYMMTQFKKTTGKYFYHYFSSFFYDRVIRMSAKNTVDSVRYDMIAEMPIYIPSPKIQQKIVDALDLLDERIATSEILLDLYEKEKNALLQKLFI